ncbi:MAG: hypothetical protein WCD43_02970 [Candidatus Acidiferrales bacterium]
MQSWQKFLDSLATKGGNLLVLFVCFAGLLSLLIHVLHHGDTGNVSMVVVSTFSGFSGALMATLTGKDSKEQSENIPLVKFPSNAAASAIPESAPIPASGTPKIDGPVS